MENKLPEIKAICTWGDGPDVLLTFQNWGMVLHEPVRDFDKFRNGIAYSGAMDLTADQARSLAYYLMNAAQHADELNQTYCQYENDLIGFKVETCPKCAGEVKYHSRLEYQILECTACDWFCMPEEPCNLPNCEACNPTTDENLLKEI